MNNRLLILIGALYACVPAPRAATLADPAAPIPAARAAVGVSYNLTGYTIGRDSTPSLMNRFHLRASLAPASFVNFGIEAGASAMEVAGDTSTRDTFPAFHGRYGFSGGLNVKLSTPFFFNDLLAIVGIGQATYFSSENQYSALYGGIDAVGGLGVQLHVKGFGYITVGSQLDLIEGKNRSFAGAEGVYSNQNNLRGWLAVEYFPKFNTGNGAKPYISVEINVAPGADFGGNVPVKEFGFSVCFGSVTKRLYGEETDIEWEP